MIEKDAVRLRRKSLWRFALVGIGQILMVRCGLDLMTSRYPLPICLPFMQQSRCDYTHATVVGSAWRHCTDSHKHTGNEDETVPVATLRCNYTALNNYRLDFKTRWGPTPWGLSSLWVEPHWILQGGLKYKRWVKKMLKRLIISIRSYSEHTDVFRWMLGSRSER